jgi:hypothetical protein
MFSGTILDFRVGVDTLYIDGAPTSAIWEDVIGVGARLTMAPDRVVTLVGVDAETMNEIPIGYVLGPGWGVSGAGDDFIAANQSPSADHFIFPAGSGHDELVGFEVENDTLTFAGTPSFSEVDYHGDTALLATYDDGNSSVLLIGLDISDAAQVHFELI